MGGFIAELGQYKHILPKQTVKALRGQFLSGDTNGATKGLKTALANLDPMTGAHRNAKMYSNIYEQTYAEQRDICLSTIYEIKKEIKKEIRKEKNNE